MVLLNHLTTSPLSLDRSWFLGYKVWLRHFLIIDIPVPRVWFDTTLNDYSENIIVKMTVLTVVWKFWQEYTKTTPKKLKIIDAYLFYVFLTGVIQFVYCCLVGTFPFNSFLSGFISCVSCFVLGGILLIIIHTICNNLMCLWSYCGTN